MDLTADLLARAEAVNHLTLRSPYGYIPSKAPGIAYVVVFAALTLAHIGLGIRYRYWLVFATLVPGGLLEVLGWAGRLWSAYSATRVTPFLMQIATLIIGPAFFSAWAYTTLGYCITSLNPLCSFLAPRMYLLVFVLADIVSLVLQAIGGGQAAVAAQKGTDTKKATKIMLAGILFQLATMTIFVALATDFIIRVVARQPYRRSIGIKGWVRASPSPASAPVEASTQSTHPELDQGSSGSVSGQGTPPQALHDSEKHNAPSSSADLARTDPIALRKAQYLLVGVAIASIMIYVRGVYRAIELAQGWTGYLITHEAYFIWLDGFPMVLCLAVFAALHPGWLLPRSRKW